MASAEFNSLDVFISKKQTKQNNALWMILPGSFQVVAYCIQNKDSVLFPRSIKQVHMLNKTERFLHFQLLPAKSIAKRIIEEYNKM